MKKLIGLLTLVFALICCGSNNAEKNVVPDSVVIVTDKTFNKIVLEHEGLVVVDFYADWCFPCRIIAPMMEQLAEEYTGSILFCKVDIDDEKRIVNRYNIEWIPAIVFFRDGNDIYWYDGSHTKGDISSKIDSLISNQNLTR